MFHAKFLGFLIFPIGIALCFIRYLLKEDESRHLDVVMNINKERKINTNKNYDIINANNLNSKFTKARGYYKCKTILVSFLKGHDFRCVCAHLEPRKKLEEVYSLITDERGINVIEKHYLEQEIKFLTNVSFDSSFVRSGTVLFILSDLAELPRNFERELYKMKVPLLSHSHSAFRGRSKQSLENSYVIFQPDFHFIKSNGFRDIITAMSLYSSSDHLPYHKRSPVVFWRGATTGGNIADDTIDNNNRSSCGEDFNCKCSNLKRVHLCRISRGAPWLDVKIYKAVHVCRGRRGLLNTMGILAPKVREVRSLSKQVWSFYLPVSLSHVCAPLGRLSGPRIAGYLISMEVATLTVSCGGSPREV